MKKKDSKKKNKFLRGCLGIFLIVIVAFIAFILWPVSEDSSIILSDTFNNNDNNWPLGDYGSIENGQLILSEGDISVLPADIQLVNGRIKASLTYISGDQAGNYGFIFRDIDDDIYNFFLINSNSGFLARIQKNGEIISDKTSFITPNGSNELMVELFGRLIRVYVNGILIAESYIDNPMAGNFSLYSSGESVVTFDDLEITDFNNRSGNITGLVLIDGEPLSAAEVIAYQVIEPETLGVVEIARTLSDDNGSYSFYLPEDSSYFIEAGTPDKKLTGDRYADLQIPDSGLDLDITIREAK
ncbi:MAG: hypothetical protein DRP58_09105 [Spirochaetes bacterium]|nr:MAG: hypothetical protein DRP58_09105 [Spirochaetota bacterium]